MPIQVDHPAIAPPRNWEMLAAWLRAEWRSVDGEVHPIQQGIYEGYATVANIMKNSPPAEREDCLYNFLMGALTSTEANEEIAAD